MDAQKSLHRRVNRAGGGKGGNGVGEEERGECGQKWELMKKMEILPKVSVICCKICKNVR